MAVEASIVVVFGEDADTSGIVVVELDPTDVNNLKDPEDPTEGVKGTFDSVKPDTPVLLVHYSTTLSITSIIATDGTLTSMGAGGTQTREVDFSFAKRDDKAGIGYANTTLAGSPTFYGNSASLSISGNDLVISGGTVPCVGKANVNVTFQAKYKLTPPSGLDLGPDETYPITIFVYVA